MKPLILSLVVFLFASPAIAGPAAAHFQNAEESGLALQSAGKLSFGPDGLLLVSDPRSSSVVAVDTGDLGPIEKLTSPVDRIEEQLAAASGAESVLVVDMAVNPLSALTPGMSADQARPIYDELAIHRLTA